MNSEAFLVVKFIFIFSDCSVKAVVHGSTDTVFVYKFGFMWLSVPYSYHI